LGVGAWEFNRVLDAFCKYKVQGKSQPGKIVASYTSFGGCAVAHTGTVTLTKQSLAQLKLRPTTAIATTAIATTAISTTATACDRACSDRDCNRT
jgi:hypothetical protein